MFEACTCYHGNQVPYSSICFSQGYESPYKPVCLTDGHDPHVCSELYTYPKNTGSTPYGCVEIAAAPSRLAWKPFVSSVASTSIVSQSKFSFANLWAHGGVPAFLVVCNSIPPATFEDPDPMKRSRSTMPSTWYTLGCSANPRSPAGTE